MKKAFIVVVGVIAVIVVAGFAVLWLVDWNSYVANAVREATGREFRIGGKVSLSLIPNIEFSASDIRLSNAPGAATPEMVSVGAVTAKVNFWSLLRRRVLIDTFVVREPKVFLEVDKAGRPNWVFKEPEAKAAGPAEAPAERGAGLPINDLHLGDVRIDKGLFSYVDTNTGQKVQAKDINLKVALADLGSLFSLTGKMKLNGKPVTVEVSVDSLRGVFSGERSAVKVALSSKPVSIGYDGSVQGQPVPGLDGAFKLDIPSVGKLASWLDRPLSQPDPGLLKVRATFATDGAKVALKGATIEGKALKAKATGSFDGTGEIKKVLFKLESGVLDIDRYLPPVPVGGKKPPRWAKKRAGSGDIMASLSADPIDLSGLRQVEGDIRITVGGVKVSGFEVGQVHFTTNLNKGVVLADLSKLELYDGTVKGKFKLDGSGKALGINSELSLDGVKVGKLVRAATHEKPAITGIASGALNATARGDSPRAIAESLSGKLVFNLGGVDIKDAAAGTVSEVKANLVLPGLERPPSLKGTVVYNKQRVNLDVTLDTAKKILSGERFAAKVAVSSNRVNALYDGHVQQKPVPGLDGKFNLDVPSVGQLAAWLGQPLSQPDPGPLKARAVFATDGAKVALKEATIEGKGLKAKATGSFYGSKPVAVFKANVDIEQMDLNAYLPPEKKKKAKVKKRATAKKAEQKKPGGWSEEPFDLTPLSKTNGDVQVKIASVRYRDLVIQSGRMAATLAGGILKTSIDELKLADGTVSASATLDGSGSGAAIDYQISVAGVQSRPLLKAFAGTDRLSGKALFEAKGKAKGGNQKELVESLNGNGRFKFLDGAIHGINLAASLRKVKTLGFGGSEKKKTDFAELSGSFVIKQGVLDNRDFKILAPLVRLGGEGLVSMPPRTIDYQIEAKLVASLKGQGGGDAMAGLPIPIRLKGPWDSVDYKVDWKSFFGLAAKDPARLKNMPADLRQMGKKFGVPLTVPKIPGTEKLGEVFKNIPGLSKDKGAPETSKTEPSGKQPEQEKAPSLPDPLKSLKGLFGK